MAAGDVHKYGTKIHSHDKHSDVARDKFFGAADTDGWIGNLKGETMTDGADKSEGVVGKVPSDFVSLTSVHAVVVPGGTGNLRHKTDVDGGAVTEGYNELNDAGAYSDEAVVNGKITELADVSSQLSGLAIGDYIGLRWYREGTHANDTVNANVVFLGYIIKYTAHQ